MDIVASLIKMIFGSKADKDRKEIEPYLLKIKAVYPEIEALSNDGLRARSEELKRRIADCIAGDEARIVELRARLEQPETTLEEKEKISKEIDDLTKRIDDRIEEKLDEILPEAFAIMKDTARRFAENETVEVTANDFDRELAASKDFVRIEGDKALYATHWLAGGNDIKWDMVHYDVQLFGGVVLHKGKIAEMATGEGKTLVATLPVFLNALARKGVHLVTVNNYLAKRDSEWMGPMYEFHGLSVACIDDTQPNSDARRDAYMADITFGTNNEYGFDYLRDNMASSPKDLVQRKHHFATITLQNYFRMYHKLAGMTGTAETEASEFWSIYKLDVVAIPTNRPVIRDDRQDLIYKTKREKYNAVIEEIVRLVGEGRPVLVGTTSVEISELLSRMLKLRGIKHNVLNAKQHQLEAQVVAEAGRAGQVTIATNMAGRGTDIKLTPEVKEAGGLAIIGTERHESRRVDRQLRGRAGRQGDPGSSQFFVSLEDDLMRLFGSGRIAAMMDRMGHKEGDVIQAGMMTKAIERAQKKVEENNFGIRKRLLEYDDVMNSQREVIYTRRRHALYGERVEIDLNNIMYDFAADFVETHRGIDFADFRFEMIREVAVEPTFDEKTYDDAKFDELVEAIVGDLKEACVRRAKAVADTVRPVMQRIYEDKKDQLDSNLYFPITDGHLGYNVPVNLRKCKESDGAEIFKVFSKVVMFTTIDDAWREHLREMDDLRQSVQNATYEQKDPLLIYKFESFGLFSKMLVRINRDVLAVLNKAYIPVRDQNAESVQRERQQHAKVDVNKLQASRMQAAAQAGQGERQKPMPVQAEKKVGRNDPCPCGSGKKYKNCHGKGM